MGIMTITTKGYNTMKSYEFHNDPGHGWLKVSMAELKSLGIHNDISSYSYRNGEFAYLEEDCDYSLFVKTWETKHGRSWKEAGIVIDKYKDNQSPVRNYDSYSTKEYLKFKDIKINDMVELKAGYSPKELQVLAIEGRNIIGYCEGRNYKLALNKIERVLDKVNV